MLPSIPVLHDYGLSPEHGFLPDSLPLSRLPDPYYNDWEAIVTNLPALILSRRLRSVVDHLPVLGTTGLEHEVEWQRAYSILCFIAHGYIWSGDSPEERLPPCITIPLLNIAEHLDVPPVATYAAVCLWNFKPIFRNEHIDNLENLATLNTFTGSIDESWFYLVSVAIEARGAPILELMLQAMSAVRDNDYETVAAHLRTFAERLTDLTNILQRMHEGCHPTVFYHRIRPFLAGSKNMSEAGLPNGVNYDSGTNVTDYRQYSGGSNAQSSLIQFFDIALGIDHRATGDTKTDDSSRKNSFIQDMRHYMPGQHARFLEDVSSVSNIKKFVYDNRDKTQLCLAYDACLAMLSAFRDKHIAIVTRYVITPSRELRNRSRTRSPEAGRQKLNLAVASAKANNTQKGTGGTALIPFLKQARDETGEPAVHEWTKSFMKRPLKSEKYHDFAPITDGEGSPSTADLGLQGLAGSWTMEDEFGGLCSY